MLTSGALTTDTIYRIGCQLLRIVNTNIYRDTSVLNPFLTAGGGAGY